MDVEGDGGAFDPESPIKTLTKLLAAKLTYYSTPT